MRRGSRGGGGEEDVGLLRRVLYVSEVRIRVGMRDRSLPSVALLKAQRVPVEMKWV